MYRQRHVDEKSDVGVVDESKLKALDIDLFIYEEVREPDRLKDFSSAALRSLGGDVGRNKSHWHHRQQINMSRKDL